MSVPERDDYDRLDEWVTGVADATRVSEHTIWEIVEELRPGASAVIKDKAALLRRLLEHHTVYMEAHIDEGGQPDLGCKIQLFIDNTVIYEFQYPGHNVVDLDPDQKEILSEIIAEEGMTKQAEGERHLAAFLPEGGLDEEVRIINRILQEVHDTSIDGIERAIEVRGQKQYTWTDEQELKEGIQQISADGIQLDQDTQDQHSTNKATNSMKQHSTGDTIKLTDEEKEYDEWIFCQNCGDRIADPEDDPRFCSNCRN